MPNFSDLKPGDILLQRNVDDSFSHAVMFVGEQPGQSPFLVIAHAMYTAPTEARPMPENVVGLSRLPPYAYQVFRCNDEDLAKRACEQALRWSKFEVPYDTHRMRQIFVKKDDAMMQASNAFNSAGDPRLEGSIIYDKAAAGFVNDANRNAWESGGHVESKPQDEGMAKMMRTPGAPEPSMDGIHRVIKFAARMETLPTFPHPKDMVTTKGRETQRGFNCSFFVTLCYQVAAFARAGLVEPLKPGEWVSNKHDTTKSGSRASPALSAWRDTARGPVTRYDFSQIMPRVLLVDPKNIDCNGMAVAMRNNAASWEDKGVLKAAQVPDLTTADDKADYKASKGELSAAAKAETDAFSTEHRAQAASSADASAADSEPDRSSRRSFRR